MIHGTELALCGCLFLLACGGGDSGEPATGGASNGGNTATAGNSGTGGSTAGATAGGSAGTLSSGSGGTTAAPEVSCVAGEAKFSGTLADGRTIAESLESSQSLVSLPGYRMIRFTRRGGLMLFDFPDSNISPFEAPPMDVDLPTVGAIYLPSTANLPLTQLCMGPGSTARLSTAGDQFQLQGSVLHTCPGEPLTDTMTLCDGLPGQCAQPVAGSLDGVDLSDLNEPSTVVGDAYNYRANILNVTRTMLLNLTFEGAGISGQIITAPTSTFAGAVYCVGSGSMQSGSSPRTLTLTGLSRLPSCADASGGVVNGCWAL